MSLKKKELEKKYWDDLARQFAESLYRIQKQFEEQFSIQQKKKVKKEY